MHRVKSQRGTTLTHTQTKRTKEKKLKREVERRDRLELKYK